MKSRLICLHNLSSKTTEEQLRELFAPYGSIQKIDICVDRFTGLPSGGANISLETPEQAKRALLELNESILNGQPVILDWICEPEQI